MTDITILRNAEYSYQVLSDNTIELMGYRGQPSDHIQIPREIDGKLVTVIGSGLFFEASEVSRTLQSVSIPSTIHTIKHLAFYACEHLSEINFSRIENNLRNVSGNAFARTAYYDDKKNWADGILYVNHGRCIVDTEKGFFEKYHKSDKLKVLKIPLDVTCIASSAFYGEKGFAFVYGQNVTINERAFCLTDIKCPIFTNSNIHASSFEETPFMNNKENWQDDCIYTMGSLLSCRAKRGTRCKIAEGTTFVSDGAFDYCSPDVTVVLPVSVKRVGVSMYPDNFLFYCEHEAS